MAPAYPVVVSSITVYTSPVCQACSLTSLRVSVTLEPARSVPVCSSTVNSWMVLRKLRLSMSLI